MVEVDAAADIDDLIAGITVSVVVIVAFADVGF